VLAQLSVNVPGWIEHTPGSEPHLRVVELASTSGFNLADRDLKQELAHMPNVATLLKGELRRIARREARAETAALKKAVAAYRSEIASLKRRSLMLEKAMRQRSRTAAAPLEHTTAAAQTKGRYSAKSLLSQRKRLGLSANELGRLIGVSAQSIYNWEEGKARPQPKYLPAVFALKTLGRRAAAAHLESIAADSQPAGA
jgi:DNA-binding transcriptional regulator YiaG